MSSARSSTSHSPPAKALGSGHSAMSCRSPSGVCTTYLAAPFSSRIRGPGKHTVADEVGDKAGGRAVVQRVGVVPLVQRAFVHDADHVANGKGFQLVVRDEQAPWPALPSECRGPRAPGAHAGRHRGWKTARPAAATAAWGPARAPAPRAAAVRPRAHGESVVRSWQAHQFQHFGDARLALCPGQIVYAKGYVARPHPGAETARSPETPCQCGVPPGPALARLADHLACTALCVRC